MATPSNRAAIVARLREHLERVAPLRTPTSVRLPVGIPVLEEILAGWPRPGMAEISGPAGTGRLGLVLPAMQDLTREGRRVAVVDPLGWLNPPGLRGVVLDRLLLVRPGATQAAWAAEQLLRCGGLPLVILLDPGPLGPAGRRLQHAAEEGDSGLCILTESPDPRLPASVRVQALGGGRVRLLKGAPRHQGREIHLWSPHPMVPIGCP